MAAAPADFRPAAPPSGKLTREGGWSSSLSRPRTSSPRLAAARAPGQTIVGFAAEHGGDAARPCPRQARPQGRRPDRPQRRLRPRDRLRERGQRGDPDRRRRARRRPARLQGRRSPRRSSTASRRSQCRAERKSPSADGYSSRRVAPAVRRRGLPLHPTTLQIHRLYGQTEPAILPSSFSLSRAARVVREVGLAHFFYAPERGAAGASGG